VIGGVTAEQHVEAATLFLCLSQIEECNIFLGLYGERYVPLSSPFLSQHIERAGHLLPKAFPNPIQQMKFL